MGAMFTIATWNINSVRLRAGLVCRLLGEEAPDILCLQECKSPVENIPVEVFRDLGYRWMVARGQRGYNGVAILSRLPITDAATATMRRLATPATSRRGWKTASPSTTSMCPPAATPPTAR